MSQTRRRIFIINKAFQFKFAFFVCSWILALSIAYPLIVKQIFELLFRYVELDPMGPEIGKIHSTRTEVMYLLVGTQAIFTGVTFIISLFVSHRIAGPLYKLSQFMEAVARGDISRRLQFRKSDYFKELAEGFNRMTDGIGGRFREVDNRLQKNIATLDQALTNKAPLDLQQLQKLRDQLAEVTQNPKQP